MRRIVAAACYCAGLAGRWGTHSLRAGFVTEAADTPGVDVLAIAEVTGHVDVNVLTRYVRGARLGRGSSIADRMDL